MTFVGYACSGAEIVQGLFLRYKGHEWVPNPPELVADLGGGRRSVRPPSSAPMQDLPEAYHLSGAVPELKGGLVLKCDADDARRIDLLLLSVGGNDIGFVRLLANAVLSDKSLLRRLGGWFGHVHGSSTASEQLDTLENRYKALNRAFHNILHIPWNEADRVLLMAYPRMALLEDGRTVCPDGRGGMAVMTSSC